MKKSDVSDASAKIGLGMEASCVRGVALIGSRSLRAEAARPPSRHRHDIEGRGVGWETARGASNYGTIG